jgi:hypothetical protein
MFNIKNYSRDNIKNDILSGLVVAVALVPEAIAFSFIVGVNPIVGLYTAFILGLVASILGGKPGMISGATGSVAVVLVGLAAEAAFMLESAGVKGGGAGDGGLAVYRSRRNRSWTHLGIVRFAETGEIHPSRSAACYIRLCQRFCHRHCDGAVQVFRGSGVRHISHSGRHHVDNVLYVQIYLRLYRRDWPPSFCLRRWSISLR